MGTIIAVVIALVGGFVSSRRHKDRLAVDVHIVWWMVWVVGIASVVGAGYHAFDGANTAELIGYTRGDGGFQWENAMGDLAIGVVGIMAYWFRGHFWLATIVVLTNGHGENTIVVSPGANSLLTADDVNVGLRALEAGDLLLLQLETPESLVRHAARTANEVGCAVVLNAAPVPASVRGLFDHVDLLVVNEHELASIANLLHGRVNARREDDMALIAAASGARVVCTAGGEGVFVTHGDRVEHIPAFPVQARDATAAGDTFIGYLAAGLAADPDNMIGAIETAVRAAGIAVTRPGAIDSIPYADEIGHAVRLITKDSHENRAGQRSRGISAQIACSFSARAPRSRSHRLRRTERRAR